MFDDLLMKRNRLAMAILRHRDSDDLTFVRSPFETQYEELKAVVEYRLLEKAGTPLVQIGRTESVFYGLKEIREIAQRIYGRLQIAEDELDRIRTIYVQATLNDSGEPNIYITNDRVLLKTRRTNIMSLEGASMFLDLLFKSKEKYYASSGYTLNKGRWYRLSMRLKLSHYNAGDRWIDALAFRFCHCLMALDEIGIAFFSGSGVDTILYHFGYLIMLMTGIFDNLALKTNTYLEIPFSDLRKVSLSKKSGREFLPRVGSEKSVIRDHITRYMNFIQLIYTFRETVVHREALKKLVAFDYREGVSKWKAYLIPISDKQKDYIRACRNISGALDAFSEWGLSEDHGLYLDPYHFAREAITTLKNFVDKYLELLGYPSFIETQKQKHDEFTKTLVSFERYHLGFEGD
jgi:hypothetical protein